MAIQVRRGEVINLDINKMLPGELGVSTDTGELYFCYSAGNAKKLQTSEDLIELLNTSQTTYEKLQDLIIELNGNQTLAAMLTNILSQLAQIATEVDTIVTGLDNYYVKCLSTDTGALLVVASGATTGQINISAVSPRMSTYTPVAGDYVTLASNLLTAEITFGRSSAVKGKTFSTLDGRLEELDGDTYFPMTNSGVNTDFSNGTTGWAAVGVGATIAAASNELTFTAAAQYQFARQVMPNVSNAKFYFAAWVKATSNLVALVATVNSTEYKAFHSGSGNYERLSVLADGASNVTTLYAQIQDRRSGGWNSINIKYAVMINLTAMYGIGNEPTQSQMDSLLSFYENMYFSGTVNLAKNTKLLPYLLNNIRQLNLEKTSYGVYSGLTVSAQSTPDMTVNVPTGIIYMANGRRFSPTMNAALAVNTADATNPRIDILYVDYAGVIRYLAGTAAVSPSAPSVPTDGQKLYEINVTAGAIAITNAMLVDRRKSMWSEAWINPTLLNGWVNNAGFISRYKKDSSGVVHVELFVNAGANTSVIFNLPSGYRPTQPLPITGNASGTISSIIVNINGDVTHFAGTNTSFHRYVFSFRTS